MLGLYRLLVPLGSKSDVACDGRLVIEEKNICLACREAGWAWEVGTTISKVLTFAFEAGVDHRRLKEFFNTLWAKMHVPYVIIN